jgi:kumamolisin
MTALDNIFKQAAAQGQSFYAGSGDTGAYDCVGNPNVTFSGLAVDSPADDPFVTGVGGTTLRLGANSSYGSESAWSDTTKTPQLGSGGGLSTMFSRPAWQTGPGVATSYTSNTNPMRQVPDVSLDADPRTGYSIYATNKGATGWLAIGGTSAAAPAWAAFTSLINQFGAAYNRPPLGFANPTLYRLGSTTPRDPPFHDVVAGNNLYYPATQGWDYATGWGSFDAYNLAHDLTAGSVPPLAVVGPPTLSSRAVPPAVPQSGSTSRRLVLAQTTQTPAPTAAPAQTAQQASRASSSAAPASARALTPAMQSVFAGLRQLARLLGGS